MKQHMNFNSLLLLCGLTLLGSCQKDNGVSQVGGGNNRVSFPIKYTFYANKWVKQTPYEYYTCSFDAFMTDIPGDLKTNVNVFLNYQGIQIPIDHSIRFLNGLIWSGFADNKLNVFYVNDSSSDNLPVSNLEIDVVVSAAN